MKKLIGALAVTLCYLCAHAEESNSAKPDAMIEQAGRAFIADPHHVGLSVGIVQHGVSHTWGFGSTNKTDGRQPDERTIYEIGSVTKTYTGILLAQAVLDGKIRLDDPVQRYLDAPYPNLAYEGRPVRIIDLANHTAGLPKHIRPPRDGMSIQQILDFYGDYSETDFLEDLKKIHLTEKPGTHFHYSNAGTQLIGIILEKLYHKSWDELVRQTITGPNGMRDTSVTVAPQNRPRQAQGYDGEGKPMPELSFWYNIPAAGSLKSTVHDQLAYLKWNLAADNRAVALSHRVSFEHTEERDDDIGLYWFVEQTGGEPVVIRHTGGSFGTTSYIAIYPKAGLGMVFLANDADSSTERALVKIGDVIAEKLASSR